jgi:chromosome segregation ATPase
MTPKPNDEDTLPPGTVLVDPTQETGVRSVVNPKMPGDDAGKLTAIYERVMGFSDVAADTRDKLDQVLRENVRIGAAIENQHASFAKTIEARDKRINESLNQISGSLVSLEENQDVIRQQMRSLGTEVQLLSGKLTLQSERQDELEKEMRELSKKLDQQNGPAPTTNTKR